MYLAICVLCLQFLPVEEIGNSLLELSEDCVPSVNRSVELVVSSSRALFLICYSAIKFSLVQKRFGKTLTYNSVKHPEEWVLALEGQNTCISLGGSAGNCFK